MESKELTIGSRGVFSCNTCRVQTHHELKALLTRRDEEEYDLSNPYAAPSWWIDYEYRLWVCLGCDTAVLQELETPMYMETFITFYPTRKSGQLEPKSFIRLDHKLQLVYKEVVNAYNNDLRIVCGMGLRALLEGICVNQGITDTVARPLDGKLQKLKEHKHLPPNIVDNLYSFKFIGDAAAHKLDAASKRELELAIEVMEHLLTFLYDMEYKLFSKSQELRNKRPPKQS